MGRTARRLGITPDVPDAGDPAWFGGLGSEPGIGALGEVAGMHTLTQDARYPVAVAAAGLVAFALFLLMHSLVATDRQPTAMAQQPPTLSVVKVRRAPNRHSPVRTAPKRPHAPPRLPHVPITGGFHVPPGVPPTMSLQQSPPGWQWGPRYNPGRWPQGGAGNSRLDVKWRFRPGYPPRAAILGVEGFVATCFTVRADGSVADARVVGASSPQARRLLGPAALQAIARWRFFPRTLAGHAVATRDVCQDIRFTLSR